MKMQPKVLKIRLSLLLAFCLPACQLLSGIFSSKPAAQPIPGQAEFARGELDQALDLLEKESTKQSENAELWVLLGEARLQLIERESQKKSSGAFVVSLIEDASEALTKADALRPKDAKILYLLARVKQLKGDTDEAYAFANEAQKALPEQPDHALRYDVEKAAAEISFAKYVALKQANVSTDETAIAFSRTFRALRSCEELKPRDSWPYGKEADLFLWEGARSGATEALKRGVTNAPEQQELQTKLVNFYAEAGELSTLVELYKNWAQKNPNEATIPWYLGFSAIRRADELRKALQYPEAMQFYQEAKKAFAKSAELKKDFQSSVDQYLGIIEVSLGWCHYQNRLLDQAAQTWMGALRNYAPIKDKPDGLGRTIKEGIALLGAEYLDNKEFERGQKLFKSLCEIEPTDFDWLNNYAFLSRETGSAMQTAGKIKEAQAYFEESYAAYLRSVALMPEDARAINDCALMLLYHLDRELDRAESMFRRSVEVGERILKDSSLPPSDEEALRSAIGDSYQNLGVLYFEKKKDPKTAKRFFEQSLASSSESRPQVNWYLNRITTMEADMRELLLFLVPMLSPLLPLEAVQEKKEEPVASSENSALADELRKASDLINAGQVNDALDLLDEIEKKQPKLADTNFLYGKAYFTKANVLLQQRANGAVVGTAYSDAVQYLEQATQQMPKNGEAFLLLAKARFASNEIKGASEAADKAAALMPKSVDALYAKGEIGLQLYMQAKESKEDAVAKAAYQSAQDSLQTLTKLSPNYVPAWEKLADLFAWAGKNEEAMDTYATALGLNPNEALAGRIQKIYNFSLWTKIFDKAIVVSKGVRDENDGPNALLHWYLGYTHFAQKQMEAAKSEFTKTVAINKEMLSAYYYLGKIHYDKKDYLLSAEAFGNYAKRDVDALARVIKEQDPEPDRTEAILLFLEGEAASKEKMGVARELAKLNATLDPKLAERWNNYAFLARETRKYEESYAAYTKALALEPDNPQLLNDTALILQYHLHRDLDKAKTMYEKAIEKAKQLLGDSKIPQKNKQVIAQALSDATGNLAKLKAHPEGEK